MTPSNLYNLVKKDGWFAEESYRWKRMYKFVKCKYSHEDYKPGDKCAFCLPAFGGIYKKRRVKVRLLKKEIERFFGGIFVIREVRDA